MDFTTDSKPPIEIQHDGPKFLIKNIVTTILSLLFIACVFVGGMIITGELDIAFLNIAIGDDESIVTVHVPVADSASSGESDEAHLEPWNISFVAISTHAGIAGAKGIDVDGNLWGFHGSNSDIRPTRIMEGSFSRVSVGSTHSMAIDTGGNLWVLGLNGLNSPAFREMIEQPGEFPYMIMEGTAFADVFPFHNYSMAIDEAGNLWAWGENDEGQLGDGTTQNSSVPIQIAEGVTFQSVSSIGNFVRRQWVNIHTIALDTSGNIWSWGNNSFGQLGDGTTEHRALPARMESANRYTSVFTSITRQQDSHAFATSAEDTDGNRWRWGASAYLYTRGEGWAWRYDITPVMLPENNTDLRNINQISDEVTFIDVSGNIAVCTDGMLWERYWVDGEMGIRRFCR